MEDTPTKNTMNEEDDNKNNDKIDENDDDDEIGFDFAKDELNHNKQFQDNHTEEKNNTVDQKQWQNWQLNEGYQSKKVVRQAEVQYDTMKIIDMSQPKKSKKKQKREHNKDEDEDNNIEIKQWKPDIIIDDKTKNIIVEFREDLLKLIKSSSKT